ncbi:Hypothetical protein SRAE_1000176800 [Strongyloides ratti]|uniref:Uncharacterized protein n=1 Tax=Strongyloides ratti TaxID=34506 RepID=A0A090L5V9_STRRB|nr:Hypothetical protein SRAE_1000176800 [Strongyloides ratti]CEF63507.1 Hypothetical protein SRAE_1000176800 [Strongyloides ratti]
MQRIHKPKKFEEIGSEESHVVESYEKRIHGTDTIEPHREYSTNQYTERKTFGRDENGEIIVKIEKDPKEPVRPVTPVQPVHPIDGKNDEKFMKPLPPLELLHIPRVDVKKPLKSPKTYSNSGSPQPSMSIHNSPHSGKSSLNRQNIESFSPRSFVSNTSSELISPIKKVTTKKRLVSIHDGRPISPFIETVTYEPNDKFLSPNKINSISPNQSMMSPISKYKQNGYRNDNYSTEFYNSPSPMYSPRQFNTPKRKSIDDGAYVIQNPLYSDY